MCFLGIVLKNLSIQKSAGQRRASTEGRSSAQQESQDVRAVQVKDQDKVIPEKSKAGQSDP